MIDSSSRRTIDRASVSPRVSPRRLDPHCSVAARPAEKAAPKPDVTDEREHEMDALTLLEQDHQKGQEAHGRGRGGQADVAASRPRRLP